MSNQNQHKPGYKHTPLGWIPEEWEVKELGDTLTLKRGYDLTHGERRKGNIPVYSSGGISGFHDKAMAKGPGVITGRYGTLGEVFYCEENFWPHNTTLYIEDFKLTNSKYAYYLLTSLNFSKFSGKSAIPGLNRNDLHGKVIPLPSLSEQRKIATILSTWDEAITKTQQLIAQQQQRNKGLMQQLLSGKKRLKGFENEEWKKLHATEIFEGVSVKNNGTERLLSATQDRGIIPRDMLEARVTMPTGETSSFKLVDKGDFVISLRSFQGGIEYSEYRGLVSSAYTVLKPRMKISTSFFKHYFKSYDFIGHLAVAVIGIRDGKQVSYEDFSILKLPYPSIEEQKAIAKVLDAAVFEVQLQERQLATLQQQKKGLMQKLLTGEIRVKDK